MAFGALARFIGVFSLPANAGAEAISMTVPGTLTSADSLAAETGRGGGMPAQAGEAGVNWTVFFCAAGLALRRGRARRRRAPPTRACASPSFRP